MKIFKMLVTVAAIGGSIAQGFPGSRFGNLRNFGNQRNQEISSLLARNPTIDVNHHSSKSSNNAKWRAELFGKNCTMKRTQRGRKRLVCSNPDDEKEIESVHGNHDPLKHYLE